MKPQFVFAIALSCVSFITTADAASPNIVLILTDDQGWSQLSVPMDPSVPDAKSDYLETPNMSKLI